MADSPWPSPISPPGEHLEVDATSQGAELWSHSLVCEASGVVRCTQSGRNKKRKLTQTEQKK